MKLQFNFNQSGVIPYRKRDYGIEVLLITSIKKHKWIIPKGYIEFNLSPFESAKKEAYEEAGVKGTNETVEIGSFRVHREIGSCIIKIYLMEVTEELIDYPEKTMRKRKWFMIEEAIKNISIPELVPILRELEKTVNSRH